MRRYFGIPPLVITVGVLLALVGLAWRVLTLGVADHWAMTAPEQALSWRADHPVALRRAAEQLAAQDPSDVRVATYARHALQVNPLDGRPYRLLAQHAAATGDAPGALALYQTAAARAPRDLITRAWLADHHLVRSEFAAALNHLDRMLRVQPEAHVAVMPALLALAKHPPAQPALAMQLAASPPWRTGYLRQLARETDDIQSVDGLWQALRQHPGGVPGTELAPWLNRLLVEGQAGSAYLLWVSQLTPIELAELGNVYNGGFELPSSGHGFDWYFGRIAGARIDRLPTEGAGGRVALRVAFDERRVPFSHLQQVLALPPGRWQLSGRARADDLRSERGLVWDVACYAGGASLARSTPLRGRRGWHDFTLAFTVPEQACPAQRLRLLLPARIPAEQRIGGRAWFDDLAIRRQVDESP